MIFRFTLIIDTGIQGDGEQKKEGKTVELTTKKVVKVRKLRWGRILVVIALLLLTAIIIVRGVSSSPADGKLRELKYSQYFHACPPDTSLNQLAAVLWMNDDPATDKLKVVARRQDNGLLCQIRDVKPFVEAEERLSRN